MNGWECLLATSSFVFERCIDSVHTSKAMWIRLRKTCVSSSYSNWWAHSWFPLAIKCTSQSWKLTHFPILSLLDPNSPLDSSPILQNSKCRFSNYIKKIMSQSITKSILLSQRCRIRCKTIFAQKQKSQIDSMQKMVENNGRHKIL